MSRSKTLLAWVYLIVSLGTFAYLTFFDGYIYNGWNWLIALPVNAFVGMIWPIYWAILRPLMG